MRPPGTRLAPAALLATLAVVALAEAACDGGDTEAVAAANSSTSAAGGAGGVPTTGPAMGGSGGTGAGDTGGAGGAGGAPTDPYDLSCEGPTRRLDAITWNATIDGGPYLAEAHRFATFYGNDAEVAAAHLAKQPNGSRALIFGLSGGPWFPSQFDRHPEDRCRTPQNELTEFPCPWFDHGAPWLASTVEPLLLALSKKGVELDALLIDAEVQFNNWTILEEVKDATERAAFWDVLENEPRMQPVLAAAGIQLPLKEHVEKFWQYQDYLKWNAAMDDIVQGYIHDAVAATMAKYYPNAEISNYGAYRYTSALDMRDYNGHHPHLFGDGTVVGNHQSREGYGWLVQLAGQEIVPGVTITVRPFHALLYGANTLRVMPLAAPEVPFHPWIAARSYKGDQWQSAMQKWIGFADTDAWQELVFHTALAGATRIAHWNVASDMNDAALVASDVAAARAALEELNALAGCADRGTLIEGLAPWNGQFLVSGLRLEDHELYRVTPDLDAPGSPALAAVVTSKEPAIFTLGGATLTFPEGRVHEPAMPASAAGVWVVQPAGAPKPTITE